MTQLRLVPKPTESLSSGEPRLLACDPSEVWKLWPLVAPFLSKACERTQKADLEDIPHLIEHGVYQLWIPWSEEGNVTHGACLTDLVTYANGYRIARILMLGGECFKQWGHLIEGIEEWAREEGCESIEVIGRQGWGRILPEYRPIEYVFSKEL